MRSRSTRSRGAGTALLIGGAAILLLFAVGGTAAALYASGAFDAVAEPSREGLIACPAAARPIASYARITRDDLINPQTRQLHVVWIDEKLDSTVVRDLSKIVGRVAAREKSPNLVFSESDFFPTGTRHGLAAGIPAGKRSFTVATESIDGLELLRQGDTFDLYAALGQAHEEKPLSNVEYAALLGGIKPPDAQAGQLARQAGVRALASGAAMVALTQGKTQSTAGIEGLTAPPAGSRRTTTETVATIAVAPDEIAPLAEALALDIPIFCVARSGRPDADAAEPKISLDGLVAIPVAVRPLHAYSAIAQEDLADPISGKLNVYYFPPERVSSDWTVELPDLLGRVLKQDVPAGAPFEESMFLPRGARPGLAAAAPGGTVVMTVPRDRVSGLADLSRGDRFAVFATLPENLRPSTPTVEWATLVGGRMSAEDEQVDRMLRLGVRRAVSEATLLDLRQDSHELAVAVPIDEVESFAQLVEGEDELRAAALPAASNAPAKSKAESVDEESGEPTDARDEYDIALAGFVQLVADDPENGDEAEEEVAVPVTVREVEAYRRLTVEDFLDPATGKVRYFHFPKDKVSAKWQTDVAELLDRVASRSIAAGRAVSDDDLLPPGSPESFTGGIPSSMRSVSLDTSQVSGLEAFRRGDRLTLLAYKPIDLGASGPISFAGADAAPDAIKPTDVRVVASEASVVDLAENVTLTRFRPTASVEDFSTIDAAGVVSRGTRRVGDAEQYETTVSRFTLSVQPDDVQKISEALAHGMTIVATGYSGRPGSVEEARLVAQPAPIQTHVVEHLRDGGRSTQTWVRRLPTSSDTSP